MELRTKEVVLTDDRGEFRFKLVELPGTHGFEVGYELAHGLLPGLSGLVDAWASGGQIEAYGASAERLFKSMPLPALKKLRERLLEQCAVEGPGVAGLISAKGVFDTVFAGAAHWVLVLMWEAMALNYAGFFDDLAKRAKSAVAGMQEKIVELQAAISPTKSAGSSPSTG